VRDFKAIGGVRDGAQLLEQREIIDCRFLNIEHEVSAWSQRSGTGGTGGILG
jgi:hypothetical protein